MHELMESVKDSHDVETRETKITNEKALANGKVSRGISLRACVAKAAGWTLEKANALPVQEASINKTS